MSGPNNLPFLQEIKYLRIMGDEDEHSYHWAKGSISEEYNSNPQLQAITCLICGNFLGLSNYTNTFSKEIMCYCDETITHRLKIFYSEDVTPQVTPQDNPKDKTWCSVQ